MIDWLSGTAMLACGLIVGFMFIYGMKRRGERSELERKDLEAKRDALIASLRVEADPEERARLEIEAASVLRKLDLRPADAFTVPKAAALPPQSKSAAVAGFLWGAGSVAVLAAIGFFVWQQSKPREGAAPVAAAAPADNLRQLQQAVEKNPNDLKLRDDLAKAYLDAENMTAVVEQTHFVLQRSPDDARALTYEALVRAAVGQGDAAMEMFKRATKSDPNLIDAWVGQAWLNAQNGRIDEAQSAIDEAKRRHPDQAQRLDMLMARLKPVTPIRIAISLAPSAHPPSQAVLFIIARAEGVTSGAPIAVKRLPVGTFPMDVEISSADSMTGGQLPPKVRIEVRVDADGNPLTKSAEDLTAAKDGVSLGGSVSLTLK